MSKGGLDFPRTRAKHGGSLTSNKGIWLIQAAWGKYVSVTFFFRLFYLQCHQFSELSLAITIAVLTPVSCYYVISCNYCGKNARVVGLTCRCHLNNIVLSVSFVIIWDREWGGNCCLPQHWRHGFRLITMTPIGVGKP